MKDKNPASLDITHTTLTVPAVTLDNIIRPMLIKKGADLPLLLIFAGVIGGLMAFGIIGLFIGPVVLAVTYTLLKAWVAVSDESPDEAEGTSP
jgi:predicted PurR-regulated permease PerM